MWIIYSDKKMKISFEGKDFIQKHGKHAFEKYKLFKKIVSLSPNIHHLKETNKGMHINELKGVRQGIYAARLSKRYNMQFNLDGYEINELKIIRVEPLKYIKRKRWIMIKEIIKENMEYFNMSNNDLSLLTGMTGRTVRNILNGTTVPNLETLSRLEDAFKLKRGYLYPYLNSPSFKIESHKIYDAIDIATGEMVSKESIILRMRKLLSGGLLLYKNSLEARSPNFYKFKNNELNYFWIALNENKAIGIKTTGIYESKNKSKIFNMYLNIMFNDKSFDERIELVTKMLSKNQIALVNTPFLKGVSIKGVSLIKNKTRYIFMNDMHKREYSYIFALGHEILHIVNREKNEDNKYLALEIKKYLSRNNIEHEISHLLDFFEKMKRKLNDEDLKILHKNTKLRINFGDPKKFTNRYL